MANGKSKPRSPKLSGDGKAELPVDNVAAGRVFEEEAAARPQPEEGKEAPKAAFVFEKMQKVYFKGGHHYREPNGKKPTSVPREAGEAVVAEVAKGKHPYFLVGYGGAHDRVNGWVDADLIEKLVE